MFQQSKIFKTHYDEYCRQILDMDVDRVPNILNIRNVEGRLHIKLYDNDYLVSGEGIVDLNGKTPSYAVCVILFKYILRCPDRSHYDPEWVAFKDFKKESHFTNVNFFSSDTERAIAKAFSGRLGDLRKAGEALGGVPHDMQGAYDLAMVLRALPRISLLMLFNDGDREFPALCKVLFQKHAELYLDPESLAMTGALLAASLVRCAPLRSE